MSFRAKSEAPKGYIPGIGRGAAGFTTRSDIGPAATGPVSEVSGGSRAAEARRMALAGRNTLSKGINNSTGSDEDDENGVYQDFDGPRISVPTVVDPDDEQADQIYAAIEEKMIARRNKRKANGESADSQIGSMSETQKIKSQFRDLKEKLAEVTNEEWASIPDVGDYSLKHKQKRREDTFTPLSDSLLESRALVNSDTTAGSKATSATHTDGFMSVANMSGLAQARGTVLGMSLDRMSTSGQTVVDPKGYLTSMSSTTISSQAEVGDIIKARLLLKSVRDTNPKHGPGWIASARVEEAAGKILQARKVIQEGCEICPTNEDVWLEAARLHPPNIAKRILATAANRIPTSTKIFLKAADLETHNDNKKAVLRKALEANPTSVKLWKAAIELEEAEGARILLSVAVEKVPDSVEMWLALARLETYENARRVLNQARKVLTGERAVWIAAAKLEESQHHNDMVEKIIEKAVKSLQKHNAVVTRAQWLEEAEHAELAGAPLTSGALVRCTVGIGVEPEDRQRTWADDAKDALSRGSVATARAILAHSLTAFPTKRSLWMQAVDMERKHGDPQSLDEVLAEASKRLPKVELFWLFRAKERWIAGDIDKAREVLTEAFAENPNSEAVWLAAAKLEWENGEIERARLLLQRARERAPSGRVYMKSALLEREEGNYSESITLIDEGIKEFPEYAKLYMMGGQICSDDLEKLKSNLDAARKYYQKGLKECPNNSVLWILASRLEEQAHTFDKNKSSGAGITKARGLLELARLKNQKNPELWLEATRLERRAGNEALAITLMARALQECPSSGPLLAENIRTSPRVEQKSKSADAIKRCPEDPHVISAVASLFASERKNDKARKWFEKAVTLNPDLGDTWARWYAFELVNGTSGQQASVKDRCIKVEPKHGELWTSVTKVLSNRRKTTAEALELVSQSIQNVS